MGEAMRNGIDLNAVTVVEDGDGKKKKGKKGKGKGKDSKKEKGGKKEKKGKKGKDKKGKGKMGGKKGEEEVAEEDPFVHLATPSVVRDSIGPVIEKVYAEWRHLDEKDNFAQKH